MPVEEGLATSPSDLSSRLFMFIPSITPLKPGSVLSCKQKYSPCYLCLLQAINNDINFCPVLSLLSSIPFFLLNCTREKPYMSVLRWRVQPGIVGRQAGTLTRAWCVSTQRCYPPSSIYGTLLSGLAIDIACISKRWAVMKKKGRLFLVCILILR